MGVHGSNFNYKLQLREEQESTACQKSRLQYLPFQEVHSDGFFVVLSEDAFAVTLDHTRLPNSSVADHDHLDGHFHVLLQHGADVRFSQWHSA